MIATQIETDWNNDMYETPDKEAKLMTGLVKGSDRWILEPAAGTGQIVKYLPSDRYIDAVEIDYCRCQRGKAKTHGLWSSGDFFKYTEVIEGGMPYDLIITNPPFSLALQFIERSLTLLNPNNPEARLLFLMPIDTLSSHGRSQYFKRLNAHIHHIHVIPGRIDYLKDGKPMSQHTKMGKNGNLVRMSGRKVSDAVFDIRPGKDKAAVSYLEEA